MGTVPIVGRQTRRGWGSIKRRNGRLYARFTHPLTGKRTMRRLRAHTLRAAESEMISLRHALENEDAPPPVEMTLLAWTLDSYLAILRSRLAEGSCASARVHIARFSNWLAENGDPPMSRVTAAHAQQFCADLAAEELKPGYIQRLVRTLRGTWRDAITHRLADVNPFDGLVLKAPDETEVPWVDPADLRKLLLHATDFQRPILTVIAGTGLRSGEARALSWDDVTLTGQDPNVYVRSGKTPAARRRVPLTDDALAALVALHGRAESPEGAVFAPRSPYGMLRALGHACAAAKHVRLTVHQLRHVYASHLVQAGCSLPTVARLLGHADHGVLALRLYGRWAPQDAERLAVRDLVAFRRATPETHPG